MSPILVRPVREQLEHDRVIRLLLVRLKVRGDVVANIGESQTVPIHIGQVQVYPDLVVTTADKGHRILETVEVETGESVNHLEAMAQWAHLGRGRAPFHLYVPAGSVEIARRLAVENHVNVAELWTFHTMGDQTRFTMVHRSPAELKRAAAELKRASAQSAKGSVATQPPVESAPAAVEAVPVVEPPVLATRSPVRPKPKPAAVKRSAPVAKDKPKAHAKPAARPKAATRGKSSAARTAARPARAAAGRTQKGK